MAQAIIESAPEIVDAFGEMFAEVAGSIPDLFDAVVSVFTGFRDGLAETLAGAWAEMETAAQPAAEAVVGIWREAVNNTISFFESADSTIRGIWDESVDNVTNFIDGIVTDFSDGWDDIKTGASNAVDNVGKFFTGMWDKVKTTVSTVGGKIGDTLGNTIKSSINGVIDFVEDGLNSIPDAINGAIDLINNLPGVSIEPMDRITLPRLAKGAVVNKPTIAQIGEAGKEAIIPLEQNKQGLRDIAQAIRGELDAMRQPQPITNTIDKGTTINLTQNNTSPKALSTYEIWRQSRNMLRLVKSQGGV
jgi:hypothetical protein